MGRLDTTEVAGRPNFVDTGKISVTWDDVNSPIVLKGNQEIDLSPERLKSRYSEGTGLNKSTSSLDSPSKRKTLDNVSELRNEADQAWESAQVDYLKRVILALDAKCKVRPLNTSVE